MGGFYITNENILYMSALPSGLSSSDDWKEIVKERNLDFDPESNPIIIKTDLNSLIEASY